MHRRRIAAAFFLSGAAGLIDEIVWSRYLEHVLGSSSWSIAVVIATYMAGLGLGSWLFGGRADRHPHPARLYVRLELLIAACAIASPLLFAGIERLFPLLQGVLGQGQGARVGISVVLSVLGLGIPTLLMGATLPVLVRDFAVRGQPEVEGLGLLYGINTLGAVAGTALAGFVLLERLGLIGSLALASSLNVAAAAIAFTLPVPAPREREAAASSPSPAGAVLSLGAVLAGLAGFGSLAAEVAWTRLLALLFGSSTWSFSIVLVGFLLGIGLGAAWVARARAAAPPAVRFALAQALVAAGAASVLIGFEPLLRGFVVLLQNPLLGAGAQLLIKAGVALVVIVPAALGMGASLPLALALTRERAGHEGRATARVYLSNTLGAILGSLVAGFLLLPAIGTFGTLRLAAVLHLATAGIALVKTRGRGGEERSPRAARLAPVGALLLALLAWIVLVRPWPAHLLNLGAFLYARGAAPTPLELDALFARARQQILWSREGRAALVSVWDIDHSRALRVNGKTDASTGFDMATQIELGLRPLLAHPRPRRVLIVGVGSGVTVRAVASFPDVERIDVVEIEPAVIEAAAWFRAVNHGIFDGGDPRVRLHVEDGRHHLLASRERYDVIISEPSNPWMSGVANLFTREFYALVRSRLAEGGVFAQWVQQYDITSRTLRRIVSTLLDGFPAVEGWAAGASDLIWLAGEQAPAHSLPRAQTWLEASPERRREARLVLESTTAEDLFRGFLLDGAGARRFAGALAPFTDRRPELEFAMLRSLGERRFGKRLSGEIRAAQGEQPAAARGLESFRPGFRDYARGRLLLAEQDSAAGREALERSIARQASPERTRWLAEAWLREGNKDRAREALRATLLLAPRDVWAAARLAELDLEQGPVAPDLRALLAAGAEQSDAPVWVVEAAAAAQVGERALAFERLRAAGQRLPLLPGSTELLARMLLVYRRLAESPGGAPEVLRELDAQAAAYPRVLVYEMLAAELAERSGDLAQAYGRFHKVLGKLPDRLMLIGRARALVGLNQRAAAESALAALRHYEPWSIEARDLEKRLTAPSAQ